MTQVQKPTPEVQQVIDKVIDKMVRLHISDGRVYLGKLMSVDKTKSIFMQDAMEILDREAPEYFDHDLFTPHLLKVKDYENHRYVLKYVGNIVIAGKHVNKIELDHRYENMYQEKAQKFIEERTKQVEEYKKRRQEASEHDNQQ